MNLLDRLRNLWDWLWEPVPDAYEHEIMLAELRYREEQRAAEEHYIAAREAAERRYSNKGILVG